MTYEMERGRADRAANGMDLRSSPPRPLRRRLWPSARWSRILKFSFCSRAPCTLQSSKRCADARCLRTPKPFHHHTNHHATEHLARPAPPLTLAAHVSRAQAKLAERALVSGVAAADVIAHSGSTPHADAGDGLSGCRDAFQTLERTRDERRRDER
jgi:hypothetical protein